VSSTPNILDPVIRDRLLAYVRAVAHTSRCQAPTTTVTTPPVEGRFGGAFVTFYHGRALRGCIGSFAPTTDLVATLESLTRSSLADPRFIHNPITLDELPSLTIEISILTDPVRTSNPETLIPGADGIIITCGPRSGCFLPKVATDRQWTAEEFLSQCCTMKAGLPADAWRNPKTQVYLFTAETFSDRYPFR
jgi:AmmeMemoRadiSam system protein A